MLNNTNEPMTKNSSQVHTTTDYFLFKSIDGNRDLNEMHYKRLKQSLSSNYLFTVIVVNENYEIIDGQHRFKVISELGLPLNYIVCEGYGLSEVHILNANSKNWNSDDYLDGYCKMGKSDYLQYKKFKDRYGFGHNETMAMLAGNVRAGGDVTANFHNGTFKVTHYDDACKKADLIEIIGQYYEGYKRRSFIYAVLTLLKKDQFEFSEFIGKLKKNPTALVDCHDFTSYISLIEEIYNYRRQVKVNLRF